MRITSEGATKITKAMIGSAWRRRKPDSRLIIRDKDCRGLALIVNATSMAWSYAYRPRGVDPATGQRWPNRTITLGNPASLSADAARNEANRLKGQAAAGGDPAAERKAAAVAAQRTRSATLSRLAADYAKVLPKRPKMRGSGLPSPRYLAEELAQIRMALADMNAEERPAVELTPAMIRGLLSAAEGVTTARHRFGPLSRFLDWAQEAGHIQVNPCTLIARGRRPKAPQAPLALPSNLPISPRLWNAADRLEEPVWRDLARFMIGVPVAVAKLRSSTGRIWTLARQNGGNPAS